jgi:outer membrane protein TolC
LSEPFRAFTRACYGSGAVAYFEFLDAERTRLQTERQINQVTAQRSIATVKFVEAMGGGRAHANATASWSACGKAWRDAAFAGRTKS